MMKHKSPDALIVGAEGSVAASSASVAATIAKLRAAGFTGTVILDTGAHGTAPRADTLADALIAGADMILLRQTPPPQVDAVAAAVMGALRSGRLTKARLEAAYENAHVLRSPLPSPLQRLVAE
jgi:hypothetical protein